MEYKNEELKVCAHIQEVERYCKVCKIFCCDECTREHMNHIDKLVIWSTVIKKYLMKSQNYQSIGQLLLKSQISFDTLKVVINSKIDEVFFQLIEKINKFKILFKEEIWKKLLPIGESHPYSGRDSEKLSESIEELDKLISEMKISKKSSDKEALINNLQKNSLKEIEKQIQIHQEMSISQQNYANIVKEFEIMEDMTFGEFKKYIKINSPLVNAEYEPPLLLDYVFPHGSRVWKEGNNKWRALCCPKLLPSAFRMTIRMNNITHPNDVGISLGICRENFQTHSGSCTPWKADQWVYYSNSGELRQYQKPGISGNKKFNTNGDLVSIVHNKNKTLYFELNGERQPKLFLNLQGPFYFWAVNYYIGTNIEIIEVTEL